MNNFEKIKAMGIDEMAETIVNFALVCVFSLLKQIDILGGSLYSRLDNTSKQEYANTIRNIIKNCLEAEIEECENE